MEFKCGTLEVAIEGKDRDKFRSIQGNCLKIASPSKYLK